MVTRAVSTWSLHRTLGRVFAEGSSARGGRFREEDPTEGGLPLLALPAELKRRGYDALQICHFHLPSRDAAYLAELRAAIAEAGITLDALLIDDGDLNSPEFADADEAWIGEWLEVAVALGATRARVGAGHATPSAEVIAESATRLARLAVAHPDVRIVTENWLETMADATTVLAVLDQAGDGIGLLIDLANWRDASKYDELAKIAPRAETCHAKCPYHGTAPDAEDFSRTLGILKDAGYDGPLALIYDGSDDDEWAHLDEEWAIVQQVFA